MASTEKGNYLDDFFLELEEEYKNIKEFPNDLEKNYGLLRAILSKEISIDVCNITKTLKDIQHHDSRESADITFGTITESILEYKIPVAIKASYVTDEVKSYALQYEMDVYRYIIDNIIYNNYSPNFLAYIASGKCSVTTNLSYFNPGRESNTMNILVTENVRELGIRTFTLRSFLNGNIEIHDFAAVLFQIIYALYIMQLYRIMHNDLHLDNILIVEYLEIQRLYFSIGDKNFSIESKYIPYIFDWDLSYCEYLGQNLYLEKNFFLCSVFRACNKFTKGFDLYKLLCEMFGSLGNKKGTHLWYFVKSAFFSNEVPKYLSEKDTSYIVSLDEYEALKLFPRNANMALQTWSYDAGIYELSKIIPDIGNDLRKKGYKRINYIFDNKSNKNVRLVVIPIQDCYPSSLPENILTPFEFLTYTGDWSEKKSTFDLFQFFRTDKTPDELKISPGLVFRDPYMDVTIKARITYPSTVSTRGKIQGEPAIENERSAYQSLFVKTID